MTPARARALLGVPAGAGHEAVEAAFRAKAWQLHPDRGGDTGAFADLAEARRVLTAPTLTLRTHAAPGPGGDRPGDLGADLVALRRVLERRLRRWLARHL